jgi:hypothetical protein
MTTSKKVSNGLVQKEDGLWYILCGTQSVLIDYQDTNGKKKLPQTGSKPAQE